MGIGRRPLAGQEWSVSSLHKLLVSGLSSSIAEVSCVPPRIITTRSVCITRCGCDSLVAVSSDFTVHVLKKNGHLPKPLNQRGFIAPGTHLAAIRDKNVRMTQTRLRDPK